MRNNEVFSYLSHKWCNNYCVTCSLTNYVTTYHTLLRFILCPTFSLSFPPSTSPLPLPPCLSFICVYIKWNSHVHSFHYHTHSMRLNSFCDGFSYLSCESFLNLKSTTVHLYNTEEQENKVIATGGKVDCDEERKRMIQIIQYTRR